MRKAVLGGFFAAILMIAPASAQNLTTFLGGSNLEPLAQSPLILNLEAQTTSKVAQPNVNAFNDFFLINGPGRLVVNFNGALQNKGQVKIPGWIGVAQYTNHEIWFDLQFGFELVKARFGIPNAMAAHVVIYQTLNTGQLVYDYAVQPSPSSNRCQEYLFTPIVMGFQQGLPTSCYWTLGGFGPHMRAASAGRVGR
jgi:hypothetical protein